MRQQPDARALASRVRRVARRDSGPTATGPIHIVQFYEHENHLIGSVTDFLAGGLAAGQPIVVVATALHREAFSARLSSKGFDIEHSRITWLDARATLATIMDGAMPDAMRFKATIGGAIEDRQWNHATVRASQDMVDLLLHEGNTDGAIALEQLWNELATTLPFSLLCTYAMGNFNKEAHAAQFHEVCRQHAHVIPTERYAQADDDGRRREISLLQQRARALETEVENGRALERQLRESVADARLAEETLRESEQELKDFLETASDGMYWVGPDGMIIWANTAEVRLLGYDRGEYVGHHIAEFQADHSAADDILARLARRETLQDYAAQLRCKDGSFRDVLISSTVLWRGGRFVHTRCFTRDVTEIKRAAAEREKLLEREPRREPARRAQGAAPAVLGDQPYAPFDSHGAQASIIEMGGHEPLSDAQCGALARVCMN